MYSLRKQRIIISTDRTTVETAPDLWNFDRKSTICLAFLTGCKANGAAAAGDTCGDFIVE
jgi:hypothetical protein